MNSGENPLQQHQRLALLNSPSMIHRSGNPFAMESRNLNSFLPQNKINPLSMHLPANLPANIAQFPPQRIPASFQGNKLNGGLQQSLNMLCDVAVGGQMKRAAGEDIQKDTFKKAKLDAPSLSRENPVLMERLSALGGGFPMPKWGLGKRMKPKQQQPPKLPTTRLGAFPMPPLKEQAAKAPSLNSYKTVWQNLEHDLRKEIFARKLQYGNLEVNGSKVAWDVRRS